MTRLRRGQRAALAFKHSDRQNPPSSFPMATDDLQLRHGSSHTIVRQIDSPSLAGRSPSPIQSLDWEQSPNLPSVIEGLSDWGSSPIIHTRSPSWPPPRPQSIVGAPRFSTPVIPSNTGRRLLSESPVYSIRDSIITPSASASRANSPTRGLARVTLTTTIETAEPPPTENHETERVPSALSHYHSVNSSPTEPTPSTTIPPVPSIPHDISQSITTVKKASQEPGKNHVDMNSHTFRLPSIVPASIVSPHDSPSSQHFDIPGGYPRSNIHAGSSAAVDVKGLTSLAGHMMQGSAQSNVASNATSPQSKLKDLNAPEESNYPVISPRESPVPWDHEAEANRPHSPPAPSLMQQLLEASLAPGDYLDHTPHSNRQEILITPLTSPTLTRREMTVSPSLQSVRTIGDSPPPSSTGRHFETAVFDMTPFRAAQLALPWTPEPHLSPTTSRPTSRASLLPDSAFPGLDEAILKSVNTSFEDPTSPTADQLPEMSPSFNSLVEPLTFRPTASTTQSDAMTSNSFVKPSASSSSTLPSRQPPLGDSSQKSRSASPSPPSVQNPAGSRPPSRNSPLAPIPRRPDSMTINTSDLMATANQFPSRTLDGNPSFQRPVSPLVPRHELRSPRTGGRAISSSASTKSLPSRIPISRESRSTESVSPTTPSSIPLRSKTPTFPGLGRPRSSSERHSLPTRTSPPLPRLTVAARTIDSLMGRRRPINFSPFGLGESYMRECRELSALSEILWDIDSDCVIDTPHIVVVGGRSVGKSSLLEGISGISLPRDPEICTRCPIECHLKNSDSWSCQIRLQFKVNEHGEHLEEEIDVPFGPPSIPKTQLEKMLRRAQKAILQPWIFHDLFAQGTEPPVPADGPFPLQFSTNVIALTVSGPELPDVVLYDLPGLPDATQEGSSLAKDLAEQYIMRQDSIVLLVISCEMELMDQAAFKLVAQKEGIRDRVIGVLTHPEGVPRGSEKHWTDLLESQHPFKNGWYCVKLAGLTQKNSPTVRAAEERFFSLEPWKSLNKTIRARLGLPLLTSRVGEMLTSMMQTQLPTMQQDIKQLLTNIREQLSDMPKPRIVDPSTEVLQSIIRFTDDIKRRMDEEDGTGSFTGSFITARTGLGFVGSDRGRSTGSDAWGGNNLDQEDEDEDISLVESMRAAFEHYKKAIERTAPKFNPISSASSPQFRDFTQQQIRAITPNPQEASASNPVRALTPSPIRAVTPRVQTPEPLRSLSRAASHMDLTRHFVDNDRNSEDFDSSLEIGNGVDDLNVDEVMALTMRSRPRGLSGPYPSHVVRNRLVQSFVARWRSPTMDCLATTRAGLSSSMDRLLLLHFGRYRHGGFHQAVSSIVAEEIDKRAKVVTQALERQLANEARPYTQNQALLDATKKRFLAQYRDARRSAGGLQPLVRRLELASDMNQNVQDWTFQNDVQIALAALSKIGIDITTPRELTKLLQPDPQEPALEVMADVRAYHHVAAIRITDVVPQVIESDLLRDFDTSLKDALIKGLNIFQEGTKERCAAWLAEPDSIIRRRSELEAQQVKLEEAQTRFSRLVST